MARFDWPGGLRGRVGPLRDNLNALEWLRFISERIVLVPAATHLPLSVAMRVAATIGAVDALVPGRTSRLARDEMRAATGLRGAPLRRAVRERRTMLRKDMVWRQRMRSGKERISDWTATETNPDGVHALLAEKRSFVLAAGHFVAGAGDVRHLVLPLQGPSVGGPIPRWRLSPFDMRQRLDSQVDRGSREGLLGLPLGSAQAPAVRAVTPSLWARGTDWTTVRADHSVQAKVLRELAVDGSVSQILIDAYWDKPGAYRRPFAGMAERGFAVGAARIARLAQCPLVPYVIVFGVEPRTVVIDWGDPIFPPPLDDKESDRTVMDQAIEFIQRGAGRYPSQYCHPIGSERRWRPRSETWELP